MAEPDLTNLRAEADQAYARTQSHITDLRARREVLMEEVRTIDEQLDRAEKVQQGLEDLAPRIEEKPARIR